MSEPVLSHCAQEVKRHDRDRFLTALFIPAAAREELLALYALNIELARVYEHVKEEMIGHIRYAWWQETIDALYQGTPRKGHPVLEALHPVIAAGHVPHDALQALLQEYREHFPKPPAHTDTLMEQLTLALLRASCPAAMPVWQKAYSILTRHRQRYGLRRNGWLHLKLLLAGTM